MVTTSPITTADALEVLAREALEVRALYGRYETGLLGREWTTAEIMGGFVVDVGDLGRLVQAATGIRRIDDVDTKLAHELADCLWSVLVLADRLGVDLAAAFDGTMAQLRTFLGQQLDAPGG